MSSEDVAIAVRALCKRYEIYQSPRDRLLQLLVPPLFRLVRRLAAVAGLQLRAEPPCYFRDFRALDGITFEVRPGETLGIIGRNGSGKSTLLQIIAGTLQATSGERVVNGRIAALLELGSGFNPEFTGRENVFLNGRILGLSHKEIVARFDDIAAFADIGDFIDQPVKTYSSGMVVRLAFAVAINVTPEILVVDEALAVGDEFFQRKCFSRIELLRKSGATILLVTHSGGTVVELCDRAILLDRGEMLCQGPPKSVIGDYQKLLYAPDERREAIREQLRSPTRLAGNASASPEAADPAARSALPGNQRAPGEEFFDPTLKPQSTIAYESRGATIEATQILSLASEPVNCLSRGRTYRFAYEVRFERACTNVRFGMLIKTLSGVELGGGVSASGLFEAIPVVAAGSGFKVDFRFNCALNPGVYFLNAGVVGTADGEEIFLHRVLDACMFRVTPEPDLLATGMIDFDCVPSFSRVAPNTFQALP
jgi:lipopolysaccharide transport system ATP-binding protein